MKGGQARGVGPVSRATPSPPSGTEIVGHKDSAAQLIAPALCCCLPLVWRHVDSRKIPAAGLTRNLPDRYSWRASSLPSSGDTSGNLRHGVVGLPEIGGGLPLEVLMFREGATGSLEQSAGDVGRVANRSMVPGQVQGGTMVLPGSHGGARCHSQHCECLYKPPKAECRRQNAE